MTIKRAFRRVLYRVLVAGLLLTLPGALRSGRTAHAVGEASTKFGVYVPPNADYNSRDPGLLVTAVQDGTTVNIVDDENDGDDDDTHLGITLERGQSYVVYIQDGDVNDDYGGPQATQGDYFLVTANKPVIVCNFTRNTSWEHSFVPATNKTMTGADFYFYVFKMHSSQKPQIDPIAYSDNTLVQLIDVTDTPMTGSGYTSVVGDVDGVVIGTWELDAGEDLLEVKGLTVSLDVGHTYHLLANKKVSLQYGTLGHSTYGRRDGGAYVPSKNGYSAGRTFYFGIPYDKGKDRERELRIVTYDEGADVSVRGWNTGASQWDDVHTITLGPHGHLELIGSELGADYYFFEVKATANVSVFETNWFETGSYGTSDIATYISSAAGTGAGRRFEAYLGPPGREPNLETGQGKTMLTHLYVFANEEADVVVYDPDAYGEWIELYNPSFEGVDLSGWTLTNSSGETIVLPDGAFIPADGYYLLEYHEKATEVNSDFLYGSQYPYFKLGNGGDTLTLDDGESYTETFTYDETWGEHGVYYALSRIDPFDEVNDPDNWADAWTWHNNIADNLGAFLGTPRAENDVSYLSYLAAGRMKPAPIPGDVVINEIMTGRIWRHFTVPEEGYYDVALDVWDWESIHNGDRPNSGSVDPEGPYLIVESNEVVSVLDTNWNDNWMTYVTAILYPDPALVYLSSHYQRAAGQEVAFTADVWLAEETLYDPVTSVDVPADVEYTLGNYVTPAQLSGATVTETLHADGSWTIAWTHNGSMSPTDGVYHFIVTATVPSGAAAGSRLRSVATTSGTGSPVGGDLYTTQDVAIVVVGADESSEVELVINEVMAHPSAGDEWIELYNYGTTDVALTGRTLSDGDTLAYTIPQVGGADMILPTDGYVIVHLGDGADSQTDLYAGAGSAGALDDTEDQVALFASDELAAGEMLDFVQWDDDGALSDPTADDLAVAAGQWPDGGWVRRNPSAGRSLGRDQYSADTNGPADWENTGGVDSSIPTSGGVNWSNPTAVTLGYFRAVRAPNGVQLEWETTSEVDNVGFNVYRSQTPLAIGHRYRVNDTLIPSRSPGGLLGATYTYFDNDDNNNDAQTDPQAPGYYWLEDVDVAGRTALHAPTHYEGAGAAGSVLYLPLIMRR